MKTLCVLLLLVAFVLAAIDDPPYFNRVPECALGCGATQCRPKDGHCCKCFEHSKLSKHPDDVFIPSTPYQKCLSSSCTEYEIGNFTRYVRVQFVNTGQGCNGCTSGDAEKTWAENVEMRIEHQKYKLRVGLGVAMPVLVLIAAASTYWCWWKPKARKTQGKVNKETGNIEVEDKDVPDVDWKTGSKSLPLG